MNKSILVIFFVLIFCLSAFAQTRVTLDWKMHDVGQVRQFISNIGSLWPTGYLSGDFSGLIYCEFPPNSYEEHVGEGGIWVGAIAGEDTLVSVTSSWHSPVEFFPSEAPWDTIWVVSKGDIVNIPYWSDYTGVSDQDFVCRYSDYNITNITQHEPLNLDVIQTSYAWSSPPLDEMIVYNFYIMLKDTSQELKDVYIAYWLDGNVGYRGYGWDFALDDYSIYNNKENLGVSMDWPGRTDGDAYSPIGIKIYPPEGYDESSLERTFDWIQNPNYGPPNRDPLRYVDMAKGVIASDQNEAVGSQFYLSIGPFDLKFGDTLHLKIGEILGNGYDGLMKNTKRLNWLIENDFHVPSPPPPPPLKTEIKNQKVILNWKAENDETNPELYQDKYRSDSSQVPFEGYKLFKSTVSATGPWTLLGIYDLEGNEFGNNTGLVYEYTDVGLLNNFEYYYTLTAFSKPDTVSDFPSQQSSLNANVTIVIPGAEAPEKVGKVAVVPNPYRGDIAYNQYNPPWEKASNSRTRWMEQDRRIQFINLPNNCEIKIYSSAGDIVRSIKHINSSQGYENWDLTSSVGQAVSSGIYLFTVEDIRSEDVQVGKFVIIK